MYFLSDNANPELLAVARAEPHVIASRHSAAYRCSQCSGDLEDHDLGTHFQQFVYSIEMRKPHRLINPSSDIPS